MRFRDKYQVYIRWGVTVLCVVAASFLFILALVRFKDFQAGLAKLAGILTPITVGVIIAYVLTPYCDWLERMLNKLCPRAQGRYRLRVIRGASVTLAVFSLLTVVAVLIVAVIPQTIESVRTLLYNMDGYIQSIIRWAKPLLDTNPAIGESVLTGIRKTEDGLKEFLQQDMMRMLSSVTAGVVEVGVHIYNLVIGLIASIYILAGRDRLVGKFKKILYAVVSPAHGNQVLGIGRETNRMFRGFIIGKVVDSAIVGILCFIGMSILRLPYVPLISAIVGVTNLIPYFGPFIGAIPSGLLILMIDPMQALIFGVFILILQQLDGNFIGPKVLGNTTGLSSFGVLFAILLGGGLFGLVGMIVSVPAFGVIYALLKRFSERRLERRDLPTQTERYVKMEGIDPETRIPGYPRKE